MTVCIGCTKSCITGVVIEVQCDPYELGSPGMYFQWWKCLCTSMKSIGYSNYFSDVEGQCFHCGSPLYHREFHYSHEVRDTTARRMSSRLGVDCASNIRLSHSGISSGGRVCTYYTHIHVCMRARFTVSQALVLFVCKVSWESLMYCFIGHKLCSMETCQCPKLITCGSSDSTGVRCTAFLIHFCSSHK